MSGGGGEALGKENVPMWALSVLTSLHKSEKQQQLSSPGAPSQVTLSKPFSIYLSPPTLSHITSTRRV